MFDRIVVHESLWVALGYGGGLIVTVAGIRVLTELVPPSVYGQWTLILAATGLFHSVLVSPLLHGLSRFYHVHKGTRRLISLSVVTVSSVCALLGIATVLVFLVSAWFPEGVSGIPRRTLLLSTGILWSGAVSVMVVSNVLNLTRRRKQAVGWDLAGTLSKYVFAAGAVLLLGSGIPAVVLGHLAASVLIAGCLVAVLWRTLKADLAGGPAASEEGPAALWDAEIFRASLSFGCPFIFTSLLGWVVSASDRYMLAYFADVHAAGIYALGYQAGGVILTSAAALLNRIFIPVLYSEYDGSLGKLRDVTRTYIYVMTPLLAGVILFSPLILRGITAAAYFEAAGVMPVIALGLYFMILAQGIANLFLLKYETRRLIALWAVPAVASLAGNLWLIPRYGAMGAAVSMTVAYVLYAAVILAVCLRAHQFSFPWADWAFAAGLAAILGGGVLHLQGRLPEGIGPSLLLAAAFSALYAGGLLAAGGRRLRWMIGRVFPSKGAGDIFPGGERDAVR